MLEHKHEHHNTQFHNVSRAFALGIILNSAFVLIEFAAGFYTNSLALLSDAGHNLSDVAGLSFALIAFKISKAKATKKFTYGYHKSTILVSLVNAVILLVAIGSIGLEAIQRFMHPIETPGRAIIIVASIGIIINTLSALLFFRDRAKDLNIRGAYLHLAMDAIVSLGVVIAGFCIYYTRLKWIDPAISLVIMLVLLISTWKILAESLRLSLDAVPESIDLEKIKFIVLKIPRVKNIHHIHIWAMSTSKNAMTAHLIVEDGMNEKEIGELKHTLKHELEHNNIHHATLETESQSSHEEFC
ncbi:cation efflux system protein [Bacteroidota bacterium]|nr:cation efflux system protein [Bacteroidota bacterium]